MIVTMKVAKQPLNLPRPQGEETIRRLMLSLTRAALKCHDRYHEQFDSDPYPMRNRTDRLHDHQCGSDPDYQHAMSVRSDFSAALV